MQSVIGRKESDWYGGHLIYAYFATELFDQAYYSTLATLMTVYVYVFVYVYIQTHHIWPMWKLNWTEY